MVFYKYSFINALLDIAAELCRYLRYHC